MSGKLYKEYLNYNNVIDINLIRNDFERIQYKMQARDSSIDLHKIVLVDNQRLQILQEEEILPLELYF